MKMLFYPEQEMAERHAEMLRRQGVNVIVQPGYFVELDRDEYTRAFPYVPNVRKPRNRGNLLPAVRHVPLGIKRERSR